MSEQERRPMNPYLAGALSGILIVLSVALAGKYFGASTTFVRTAGMVESVISAERVSKMPYFIKEAPKIDWQTMFLVGIFAGSLVTALLRKEWRLQSTPDSWAERFGPAPFRRGMVAFVGGVVAMFGARLADG